MSWLTDGIQALRDRITSKETQERAWEGLEKRVDASRHEYGAEIAMRSSVAVDLHGMGADKPMERMTLPSDRAKWRSHGKERDDGLGL